MAVETAPSPVTTVPATPRQQETIARFERNLHIPKAQRKDASAMNRAQASEYISELIAMTQEDDEDETPAAPPAVSSTQPNEREQAAQDRQREQAEQTIAQQEQRTGTTIPREFPPRTAEQGEWPPVPPQSSEAQRPVQPLFRTTGEATRALLEQEGVRMTPPAPQTSVPANDDPFSAPGGQSWADLGMSQLGDEDDEIDLERSKLAPVGVPLGFQVISSEKKPAKPGGYPGILITAKVVVVDTEKYPDVEPGGTATDYISLSPNARWKIDEFLDACHAPPSGKINYRQFVGWTFWARCKRDDYASRNEETGEERVFPKAVIDKYLDGPTIKATAPSTNGTASREKVQARLGEEFS
jgi:hypothetical protein